MLASTEFKVRRQIHVVGDVQTTSCAVWTFTRSGGVGPVTVAMLLRML